VDCGDANTGSPGRSGALAGARLPAAPRQESSLTGVEDGEVEVLNPFCSSPGRGGQCGGRTMAVKQWRRWQCSGSEGGGKRGVEGAVRTSKGHLLLLGPEGGVGRRWPASKEGRKWVAL
jgi:hypothetical protein